MRKTDGHTESFLNGSMLAIFSNFPRPVFIGFLIFATFGGYVTYLIGRQDAPDSELLEGEAKTLRKLSDGVLEERRLWDQISPGVLQSTLPKIRKPEEILERGDLR